MKCVLFDAHSGQSIACNCLTLKFNEPINTLTTRILIIPSCGHCEYAARQTP